MPHGHPDWGEAGIVSTIFKVMDLGELAARLGSINTFDRRGNVVLQEDFSGGLLAGSTATLGADSYVRLSTNYFRSSPFSLRQAKGYASTCYAYWSKEVNFLVPGGIGLEWHLTSQTDGWIYVVKLLAYDGVNLYHGAVKIDLAASILYYYNSAGGWTVLKSPFTMRIATSAFHAFKLVLDTVKGEYIHLLVDDDHYDLLGVACYRTPDVSRKYLHGDFDLMEGFSGVASVYLDDVIFTQNED